MPARILTVQSDPELRAAISRAYRMDEARAVETLAREAALPDARVSRIQSRARTLIENVRSRGLRTGTLDAFLGEYDLSTEEGIVMMCLAEALLRIPDAGTVDALIHDKLARGDWRKHLGRSESLLVNAASWALMLTGEVLRPSDDGAPLQGALHKILARGGEPIVREAMQQAMRLVGRHFVLGETMPEALQRALSFEARGYRYSFDRLGEAAQTAGDAGRYFDAYAEAIALLGQRGHAGDVISGPGISVKLSALHPRFEFAQRERVLKELVPRLHKLCQQARAANIGLTVDAEEAERLELTLDVFGAVFSDPALTGWEGFGLAVQAYQKRARSVIDWLAGLAAAQQRLLPVRLVKGAYWDSEIKRSQELGLDGYPVFTRKSFTDVSYLACAKRLFACGDWLYPQFASHNALTLAAVLELAPRAAPFECQRLHGMGEDLYEPLLGEGLPCRIYAPVGNHRHLLSYLVRRLLENGANTSFVNRIRDADAPIESLIEDPVASARQLRYRPHPRIPLPVDLYLPSQRNSTGLDLSDAGTVGTLTQAIGNLGPHHAGPLISGKPRRAGVRKPVTDPSDRRRVLGTVIEANARDVEAALVVATKTAHHWDAAGVEHRAAALDRMAELLERDRLALIALIVREGGRTLPAAVAELREAADFCRYYAMQARASMRPLPLPGPTGESNTLHHRGRGVMLCISPWNFPLAIFTGQIAAALATGNTVIAKPAAPTPLIAAAAVRLFHAAGVPPGALQLLPGHGASIGARLVADARIQGVLVTGSVATAQAINRQLAARAGAIIPLIAETGGQNAMIVDSTALPEQVVADVLRSAFDSAGQRCSALRLLCLQKEIAKPTLDMLTGALAELRVGDPARLETDVGPVISDEARSMLERHVARMKRTGRLLGRAKLAAGTEHGSYFAPCVFEIDAVSQLRGEVFGPILHVIRYSANQLDALIDAINGTGFGLTFGLHSRIDSRAEVIASRIRAGNVYINRNMIGAAVGVQPFGGMGLSGTGPKAGGPDYLRRLAVEQTVSVNTAAMGGNASLLALEEDAAPKQPLKPAPRH